MAGKNWIFHSTSAHQKIGAQQIQPEMRYASGQISMPSKVLTFEDHIFRTDSKREADVIRESHSFKIGKVREITEYQYSMLSRKKAAIAASSTADNYITEDERRRSTSLDGIPSEVAVDDRESVQTQ